MEESKLYRWIIGPLIDPYPVEMIFADFLNIAPKKLFIIKLCEKYPLLRNYNATNIGETEDRAERFIPHLEAISIMRHYFPKDDNFSSESENEKIFSIADARKIIDNYGIGKFFECLPSEEKIIDSRSYDGSNNAKEKLVQFLYHFDDAISNFLYIRHHLKYFQFILEGGKNKENIIRQLLFIDAWGGNAWKKKNNPIDIIPEDTLNSSLLLQKFIDTEKSYNDINLNEGFRYIFILLSMHRFFINHLINSKQDEALNSLLEESKLFDQDFARSHLRIILEGINEYGNPIFGSLFPKHCSYAKDILQELKKNERNQYDKKSLLYKKYMKDHKKNPKTYNFTRDLIECLRTRSKKPNDQAFKTLIATIQETYQRIYLPYTPELFYMPSLKEKCNDLISSAGTDKSQYDPLLVNMILRQAYWYIQDSRKDLEILLDNVFLTWFERFIKDKILEDKTITPEIFKDQYLPHISKNEKNIFSFDEGNLARIETAEEKPERRTHETHPDAPSPTRPGTRRRVRAQSAATENEARTNAPAPPPPGQRRRDRSQSAATRVEARMAEPSETKQLQPYKIIRKEKFIRDYKKLPDDAYRDAVERQIEKLETDGIGQRGGRHIYFKDIPHGGRGRYRFRVRWADTRTIECIYIHDPHKSRS